jgi:hypothetical protein
VNYCIAGVEGGIELKFSPMHPRLPINQVLTKGKGLRRSQIIYASRRTWAGGRVWCMIGTPEASWLIDLRGWSPEQMDAIATASLAELDAWACWQAPRDPWAQLPLHLTRVQNPK